MRVLYRGKPTVRRGIRCNVLGQLRRPVTLTRVCCRVFEIVTVLLLPVLLTYVYISRLWIELSFFHNVTALPADSNKSLGQR